MVTSFMSWLWIIDDSWNLTQHSTAGLKLLTKFSPGSKFTPVVIRRSERNIYYPFMNDADVVPCHFQCEWISVPHPLSRWPRLCYLHWRLNMWQIDRAHTHLDRDMDSTYCDQYQDFGFHSTFKPNTWSKKTNKRRVSRVPIL